MSQLKKLERDKKTNFDRFNQKFLESDSLIEQEQEAAKKIMKIKKNVEFEDDDNMIDDLGINMKNLFFTILEMLADKKNPIPYIMDNSKRQFTFAIMIISIGGLLMFFSNLMISN